jgi:hypothetical protein
MSVTFASAHARDEDARVDRAGGVAGAGLLCLALAVVAGPALAQSPTASPTPKGPSVEGEVTGGLARGSALEFIVDATMPGGWEALHLVEIVVRSGGDELERMRYDIEDVQLKVGDQEIVVGTGGVASGEYLRVNGSDVVVTTGAGNLSFHVTADVLKAIPEDPRFELGVVDDLGTATSVTRRLAEPPQDGGLSWETVVTAVLVALLAGGFIGNLFASKRRPPPKVSVYGTIDRRLRAERETPTGG